MRNREPGGISTAFEGDTYFFYSDAASIPDLLQTYPDKIGLLRDQDLRISLESERKIRNVLERIENLMTSGEGLISLECFVYLAYLVWWAGLVRAIEMSTSGGKADKMLSLLSVMEKNHHQNRQIEYYTRQVPVAPSYLSELCRTELKMGFRALSDLLLMIRIFDLFFQQRKTMGEIANELHFADQAHFSHFFKSKMRITPREFREKIII